MTDFVHLHLHTEYSLLDGAAKVDDLIDYLVKHNINACAVTDEQDVTRGVFHYATHRYCDTVSHVFGILNLSRPPMYVKSCPLVGSGEEIF